MKNIYKYMIVVAFVVTTFITFDVTKKETSTTKDLFSHQLELNEKYGSLTYDELLLLPKQDRPDLAALQHFEMTKDVSLGYPPIERKLEAFKRLKENYKLSINAKAIDDVTWDERGPNNVGGRTRALMFDPNDATNKKVLAGAISGGLWINQDITDANIGWTNVDDFMASLSIATLTYDPNNTTTFYLGTGERYTHDFAGLGIWKSTDGGANWAQLTNTAAFSYVPKMLVTSNSTIIAATKNGIKRSTDGGDSWESPSTADVDMADVELASNGDLYAGDFAGRVHKSTDDGVTWTSSSPSSGGARVEIGLSNANSDVVYAMAALSTSTGWVVTWLSKSTDGGATWSNKTIPKYSSQSCSESTDDFTRGQTWYDLIIGVHPTDEDIVIVGGIDLHKSTDGGATWGMVSYWTGACDAYVHADQHAIVFRPGNPNEAVFGNDGGVFYSSNVGDAADPNFTARNKNYNVTQFYDAATVNEVLSNEFLAGAQDNGTQRFLDAGVNSTSEATGGDGAFCHIDQDNPNYQISSYVFSNYFLSSNHGSSFGSLHDDGDNRTGRFINPTEYDSDANILYGAAGFNQIGRISNITTTPTGLEVKTLSLGSGQISTIKASPFTDNRIFVGTGNGSIYRLDNANATISVTDITGNFDANGGSFVSSIDVGSSDNQLIITYSNYGSHSVFETTDGGNNWVSKDSNLDDFPVYGVVYNPSNRQEVLLATELGVWSTDDITAASPVWETTNIGLANVSARMIKFRSSDGLVMVATHGRGLYTSTSFGPDFIADFTTDKSKAYTGIDFNFTNSSIGVVDNLMWNFGDGYTSTANNPAHKFAVPGIYTVTLEINNGGSVSQKEITVLPSRSIPYLAANGGDFESNLDDFVADNVSGTPFQLGKSSIAGKDGTKSGDNAWVTGLTASQYVDNSLAYLYSPGYDFSAAGTYTLSFDANYSFEEGWDGFIVEYSITGGGNWQQLDPTIASSWYDKIGEDNPAQGWPAIPLFTGVTSGFETKTNDVSFLAGNAKVGFRIYFKSDAASTDVGMAIDDFEINGPSSIPTADFLSTNPNICEGETVIFNDNSIGTISNYTWSFGSGASPESASGSGPHEVTYTSVGNYTTTLTATGSAGDVVETKVDYVSVINGSSIDNSIETNLSEFTVCDNFNGVVTVKISNVGIRYQAFNNDSGVSMGAYKIGNGSDINLEIGSLTETVSVFVKSTDVNGCESVLTNLATFTSVGPNDKTTSNDYASEVCDGSVVTFTVKNSDVGVTYIIENTADNTEITSKIGDGGDITLETGEVSEAISVAIKAIYVPTSCAVVISDQLDIEVSPLPDATITQSGSVMEVASGEKLYQWYFEGTQIEGANRNFYNPGMLGDFTCEVTSLSDCMSVSDVFTTLITGSIDDYFGNSIFLYPNPAIEKIVVDVSNEFKGNVELKIYNLNGALFFSSVENKQTSGFLKEINVSNFNRGIYFVELQFGNKKEVRKIVIK